MREDDHTSSANPDLLVAFRDGTREVDLSLRAGVLDRLRAELDDFLRSRPEYGSGTPRLDAVLRTHLAHTEDLGEWVGAVALAFIEAGQRVQATGEPGEAAGDWAKEWVVDDGTLADQLCADSSAAEADRRRGRELADEVMKNRSDLDRTRRAMAELGNHEGDVIFTVAFLNRLGPARALDLERSLVLLTQYSRYQTVVAPDGFDELLRPFDETFATATSGLGRTSRDQLTAGFLRDFLAQPHLSPADLSNLLQAGAFGTDFLVDAARRMFAFRPDELVSSQYPSMINERWPGVQYSYFDARVAVLAAVGRDPGASYRLMADSSLASRLMRMNGDWVQQPVADITRAAVFGGAGDGPGRDAIAFDVAMHHVRRGGAPAEMRHVLADIVAAHIQDVAVNANAPAEGPSALNADGTFRVTWPDLERLLHIASESPADSVRVLDAMAAWTAGMLARGEGWEAIGRTYLLLARANDLKVGEARASDERHRKFAESIDKVVGMIPIPGPPLVSLAGDGAKALVENRVTEGNRTNDASNAMTQANEFSDAIVRHLDYMISAAALARDPAALSDGAKLIMVDGEVHMAPPRTWQSGYQRWLWNHREDPTLKSTRTGIEAAFGLPTPFSGG
ncbi:MAG: hypothetical protein ABR598_03230 [Candidatus Dormibacteria bacterium]